MKGLFIIANWKSNKTIAQATEWIDVFTNYDLRFTNKEVIVCPSFTLLPDLKSYILNHKSIIKLGAQDISPYDEGPYTGAVNGRQLKELVDYVIIGHSERRKNFNENEQIISEKLKMAVKYRLTPMLCISNTDQLSTVNPQVLTTESLIVYEPPFAIGTGHPDSPEDADKIAQNLKEKINVSVLYGGSVTADNVRIFTQMPNIDGVMVGGTSLDAQHFAKIISNV